MMSIKRKIAENEHVNAAAARETIYAENQSESKRTRFMIERINNPDALDRAIMEMPLDEVRERLGMENIGGEVGNGTYENWLKSRLDLVGWIDQAVEKMMPHVFMTPGGRSTGEQDVKAAREWLASQVKKLIPAPGGNRP